MITSQSISDPESLEAFRVQLQAAGLPYEDLAVRNNLLFNYFNENELVGTGGVEVYGNFGLIRSVSITENSRGKKLGSEITQHLIKASKENHLKGLYLLTETAREFFLKHGFMVVDRDQVDESVKVSSEFSHVCPVSATCMYLSLE